MKKNWKRIGSILLSVFLVCLITFTVVAFFAGCIVPYSDYIKNKDYLVPVTATVSYIREHEDSDDDTYYEFFLTYDFEDTRYENIRWDTSYQKKFRVGNEIRVEISSKNPEYIKKLDIGTRTMVLLLLAMAALVAVVIYELGFYRNTNPDHIRVIDEKMVLWELSPKVLIGIVHAAIGFASGVLGATISSPDLIANAHYGYWILGGGLLAMGAIIRHIFQMNRKGYTLSVHKCLRKWTNSDSDSSTSYVEVENLPVKRCDRKVYPHSEEGKYYYVLSNKKGEIMEVYDHRKWTMNINYDSFEEAGKKIALRILVQTVVSLGIMFLFPFLFETFVRLFAV